MGSRISQTYTAVWKGVLEELFATQNPKELCPISNCFQVMEKKNASRLKIFEFFVKFLKNLTEKYAHILKKALKFLNHSTISIYISGLYAELLAQKHWKVRNWNFSKIHNRLYSKHPSSNSGSKSPKTSTFY